MLAHLRRPGRAVQPDQVDAERLQRGEGRGHRVPPQVASAARKPLAIGFQEIAADKIRWSDLPDEPDAQIDEAMGDAGLDTADSVDDSDAGA